jgi:hypothetical protein
MTIYLIWLCIFILAAILAYLNRSDEQTGGRWWRRRGWGAPWWRRGWGALWWPWRPWHRRYRLIR